MSKKTKRTLDKPAQPRPAYVMPPPNSDAEAYNWELRSLRKADPNSSDRKDPDAGESIFRAPQETMQTMRRYGHDAQFICPKYLQIMLDRSEAVRKAANAAAEARYTKEAIDNLRKTIDEVFRAEIIADIKQNFDGIATTLAQFYAARIAHIKKFGKE